MARKNGRVVHALFQSVGDDGTTWLFVIQVDDKWAITRDGAQVELGAADRMGIGTGVKRFLQLSAVGNHNWRSHAPNGLSAHLTTRATVAP